MVEYHPKQFGKYLLLDKIAIGGMAELYRAMITGVQGFEKLIAIKRILPHLVVEENLIKAFIDEAKLAALLHHQNIVQIYDFGSLENTYFIAMEYLFGKDVRLILKKAQEVNSPLSLPHALYITAQAGAGLDYAHKLKDFHGTPLHLIHRDISPPNILITFEGNVKVVDFGIAKAATQRTMTQVGMIKGKVAYMSPEQAGGEVIDHRSDIFSCGILLYEMATGKKMFEGDTLHILAQVREASFAPPEHAKQDLPSKLIEILHRSLAKDPADRYQTMGDMVEDLEECLYLNNMRPTAHSLADYLKEIFKEEIAKEESDVRALVKIGASESEETSSGKSAKNTKGALGASAKARYHDLSNKIKEKFRHTSKQTSQNQHKKDVPGKSDQRANAETKIDSLAKALKTAKQKFRPTKFSGFSGMKAYVEVLKNHCNAVGRTFCDAIKPAKRKKLIAAGVVGLAVIAIATMLIMRKPAPTPDVVVEVPQQQPIEDPQTQGYSALQEGRFEDAALIFEELLINDPALLEALAKPYGEALSGQAKQAAQNNPEKAMDLLQRAADIDPENSRIFFELGSLYLNAKDYPKAIEYYEKSAVLDPSSADTFFNLGFIHTVNKNLAKAEEMFLKVVSLKPSYLDEALFNLAVIQNMQGKTDDSLNNLKKALEVNPNNKLAQQYLDQIKE